MSLHPPLILTLNWSEQYSHCFCLVVSVQMSRNKFEELPKIFPSWFVIVQSEKKQRTCISKRVVMLPRNWPSITSKSFWLSAWCCRPAAWMNILRVLLSQLTKKAFIMLWIFHWIIHNIIPTIISMLCLSKVDLLVCSCLQQSKSIWGWGGTRMAWHLSRTVPTSNSASLGRTLYMQHCKTVSDI